MMMVKVGGYFSR